ncbi:flavin reductase family protein [Halobacillus litoralis]|uniref:flavin reductase family protein n=1 Tax=Halobacillus litoralis TaxID=45668 RepID=UPI001CD54CC7|nr:flavin reductase family protein [Halobacillus litoralis]MCA0972449.1 flavin reductase family protein [Halobacillus litoralis]
MRIHKDQFQNHDMSKLIKGAVVPRPIAWVSTISRDGTRNLAPFSFFTVASMNPITLCFSVGGGASDKDTLANIKETGQFIVNIVSESLANQMHETSLQYSPEEDEFEKAGTQAEPGDFVDVPRVAESPVQMECELDQVVEVGTNSLVLGTVVGYHIHDDVYMEKDKVNPDKLKPVGRMAGDYSYIREFYSLPNNDLPK